MSNGAGDGITHNLYVNEIALLTITDSYFHDVNMPGLQASDPAGHEIKSRAEDTVITNSRIFDLNSGASYSIDLPNGGNATITNNVIEQGPNTQNPYIIAYGEEAICMLVRRSRSQTTSLSTILPALRSSR